jgi:hypothetical protein
MWKVVFHPAADAERGKLPANERKAIDNAVRKLEAIGPDLPHPHSSAVIGAEKLRELRPRAGNSPWRALYRQVGEVFVVAAVCPEAENDSRGFKRGCDDAAERLAQLEE